MVGQGELRTAAVTSPRLSRRDGVALGLIVLLGLWLRIGGLSGHDPWFDDAWVVLTGRYGLHDLLRMSASAPGYDLGLTTLWNLDRSSMVMTQLPQFALGLAGIVAVFALVRWFGCRRPLPHLAALVIAASPVAVAYSTRLKPYAFDLVATCLLLYLAERWRRDLSLRSLGWLAASSLLVTVSAATLPVLAAIAAMMVTAAVTVPRVRMHATLAVAWLATLTAAVWWASIRHFPPSLAAFWKAQGAMLATNSTHRTLFSLQQMGSGFVAGMLNTPLQAPLIVVTSHTGGVTHEGIVAAPLRPLQLLIAASLYAVLAVVCAMPLLRTLRTKAQTISPGYTAALAVLAGLCAGLLGRAPFGGGRTDEVLYPAVILLVALAAESIADRATSAIPTWLRWGAVGVACAGLVAATVTQRPFYPTSDVRGIGQAVLDRVHQGQVVIIDGDATFSWAADRLSPTAVAFERPGPISLWTQGFHEVSRTPRVVLAGRLVEPDIRLARSVRHVSGVWFVSEDIAAIEGVGYATGDLNVPVVSPTLFWLKNHGFTHVAARLHRLHAYALLLERARDSG